MFSPPFADEEMSDSEFAKKLEEWENQELSNYFSSQGYEARTSTTLNNSSCFSNPRKQVAHRSVCGNPGGVKAKTHTRTSHKQNPDAKLKELSKSEDRNLTGLFKKAKAKVSSKKATFKTRAKSAFVKLSSHLKKAPSPADYDSVYGVKSEFSLNMEKKVRQYKYKLVAQKYQVVEGTSVLELKSRVARRFGSQSRITRISEKISKLKFKKTCGIERIWTTQPDQNALSSSLGGLVAKGVFDDIEGSDDCRSAHSFDGFEFEFDDSEKKKLKSLGFVSKPVPGFVGTGICHWVQKLCAFATGGRFGTPTPNTEFPIFCSRYRLPNVNKDIVSVSLPLTNSIFAYDFEVPVTRRLPLLTRHHSFATYQLFFEFASIAYQVIHAREVAARIKLENSIAFKAGRLGRGVCKSVGLFGTKSRMAMDGWISNFKNGNPSQPANTNSTGPKTGKKTGFLSLLLNEKPKKVPEYQSGVSLEIIKIRMRQCKRNKERAREYLKNGGKINAYNIGYDGKPVRKVREWPYYY